MLRANSFLFDLGHIFAVVDNNTNNFHDLSANYFSSMFIHFAKRMRALVSMVTIYLLDLAGEVLLA